MNVVTGDPVVFALIQEFGEAVDFLEATPDLTEREQIQVVRELCQLSRDAKFNLGAPGLSDPAQAAEVAQCFRSAVSRIHNLWPENMPPEVAQFCDNICERADRCTAGG